MAVSNERGVPGGTYTIRYGNDWLPLWWIDCGTHSDISREECLNYGCVPSKSLIHVGRVVQQVVFEAYLEGPTAASNRKIVRTVLGLRR